MRGREAGLLALACSGDPSRRAQQRPPPGVSFPERWVIVRMASRTRPRRGLRGHGPGGRRDGGLPSLLLGVRLEGRFAPSEAGWLLFRSLRAPFFLVLPPPLEPRAHVEQEA